MRGGYSLVSRSDFIDCATERRLWRFSTDQDNFSSFLARKAYIEKDMKFVSLLFASVTIMLASVSCETTQTQSGAETAATVKPYPLDTCLVTDEGLESKGGSFTMVHEGQEVKVCCFACKIAFKDEPDTYLAKLP